MTTFLACLVALLVPLGASAQDRMSAGEAVHVEAPVQGDLAAAGRTVSIAAPVEGYALAAGRRVEVLGGGIADDLWAAGAEVVLDAPVGDNAHLAGRVVRLQEGTRVEGDVRVAAASVSLAPGAVVRGDLVVRSPAPPEISPEAQVLGEVRYDGPPQAGGGIAAWLAAWLFWFLALLVVGFVALWLFAPWAGRVARALRERPGASALAGLGGVVLTPMAIALLAVTVIGIPLALILLGFYVVGVVLAGALVAYRVGGMLLAPEASRPWPRMALGALIVSAAMSLPWLGGLAQLLVLLLGFGALVLERWSALRQPA
jgi:hypothetical protein